MAAVNALPWVQDGIDDTWEDQSVIQFQVIIGRNPEAALLIAALPWVHDGLDDLDRTDTLEHTALVNLASLISMNGGEALRIASLPLLETIEPRDLTVLQTLEPLTKSQFTRVLDDPMLADGIDDHQVMTVVMLALREQNQDAMAFLEDLTWVSDGIVPPEDRAILVLRDMALEAAELFRAIAGKAWLEDGLSEAEAAVVSRLTSIGGQSFVRTNLASALQIVDMPFLEVVDDIDAAAMTRLSDAHWSLGAGPGHLAQVLSHPALINGITDAHAAVMAAVDSHDVNRLLEALDGLVGTGDDGLSNN